MILRRSAAVLAAAASLTVAVLASGCSSSNQNSSSLPSTLFHVVSGAGSMKAADSDTASGLLAGTQAQGLLDALNASLNKASSVFVISDAQAPQLMKPRSKSSFLAQAKTWLQQARVYTGNAVTTQGPAVNVKAGVTPSTLCISTTDAQTFQVAPAFNLIPRTENGRTVYDKQFVADVLIVTRASQTTYITSHVLYDWLKNDKWSSEFTN